ncbi:MAG: VWA domain-containing protein [Chloroflexota bacterium]|nr:VWA domain-containing protein [Chloroflexota bacterium]
MSPNNFIQPEELYQTGLRHFNRGEWSAAISVFTALQDMTDQYPDVDELIADARLKLQFEGGGLPAAMPPPRRPVLLPIVAGLALCLAIVAAITVYQRRPSPPEVIAVATAIPPTTTPQPTVRPTSAPPTTTPPPTEVAVISGTLQVSASDESIFVTTPRNIEIIFDGSGSMRRKVAGSDTERWQVAQEALRAFLTSGGISPQTNVALRTYGRQRTNDCGDYEVVQNLSLYNRETLLSVVDTLVPVPGARTPLAFSIRAAADDLRAAEGSTALIVITDGDETCNGDPAAEAANFVKDVPERKVHVIGFALDTPGDNAKLQQIAQNGNGLYFDASNGAELAAALAQTIQLPYQVVTSEGNEAARGIVGGEPIVVPPGTYTLRINATPPIERVLDVANGEMVNVLVQQQGGNLTTEIRENAP